ncbi:MAG: SpoIIE family protein phosphatase [Coriobacteriia bacterium]|nr:SpoIIE family protein phosphatase [Coriobacteriia bacterium]
MFLATIALVTVAVVLLAATSVTGVYRTVRGLEQKQLAAEGDALLTAVRSRFRAAADMLEGIVSGTESVTDGLSSRQWLAAFEHFDRLLLVEGSGKVVSAYPRSAADDGIPREVRERASPMVAFVHLGEDPDTGEPVVWAVRTVGERSRDLVAGRVRTGFIADEVAASVGSDGDRLACVASALGPVAVAGSRASEAGRIVYADAYEGGAGEARLVGLDLSGDYRDVTGLPGLSWRIAILEPRSSTVSFARVALTPAAVAGLVVSILAVIGAAISGRLLVSPLKDLERRAQRAASGAYVRTMEVGRRDEVGRLSEAINDLTTRLNALHDISRLLRSAARTEQVLDSILSAVAHIAPSASAAVFLTDMVSGDLVAERLPEPSAVRPGDRLRIESELALGQVLLAEGPVSLPPGRYGGVFESRGELLGIPLSVSGEAFGLLLLYDGHRPFSDAAIETLGTFAAQAAVALRNSRLFEAEYASRVEAEALREVAEHLANPTDLASALASVRDVAGRLLGADSAVLAVRDREAYGLPPAEDAEREALVLEVLGRAGAGASGGAVVVEDVEQRDFAEAYRGVGVRSLILVPLATREEAAGGIGFEYRGGSVWFGEARLGLANTIAKQVSLALANAYLFAQAQRRAINLDTIFRISQAVGLSLETKVVLDRVLDVVQKIFSGDAVSLMRYDRQKRTLSTEMARGMVSAEILEMECSPSEDVPGEVFETRRPKVLGMLDPTNGGLEAAAAARGLRALLAVPLLARGRSIGVLCVFSREPHSYREEDIELLSTFASQAALAIDTAALYGREHAVATVLQSSILPGRLPYVRGIDADSVYRPAGRDAEIGGDYYDLFQTVDGKVVVAMCDVCGKGVGAATKTSMVKYSVRALAAAGLGPARILTEVNRIVTDAGDSADIVTLVVGEIDPETDTLTYANGGHPPGLLTCGVGTEVVYLAATGPLLGAVGTASFAEARVPAPEGSTMVIYTDGVTEARRGNRFFGEKRVRRALVGGGSAADVTRRITASLRRFTPGELRDDVAILTVRRTSGGERPGAGFHRCRDGPRKGRALDVD